MVGTKPSPYSIFYSMDRKLTEKIQAYLQTEPAKRNVVEGATLLLSLNRNRILFQNVVKRPEKFADKVEYELKKHLQIRLDDKTMSEVAAMDATVVPFAENTLNKRLMLASDKADDIDVPEELEVAIRHAGKRTDHDELPMKSRIFGSSPPTFGLKSRKHTKPSRPWTMHRFVTDMSI